MQRIWMVAGALAGLGAVAMAALAAHALAGAPEPAQRAMASGVQMEGWHALALLATGLWAERRVGLARTLANVAGVLFVAGTVCFCGAVYASALRGISLGPVAPVGGTALMAGWLMLAASALPRG